MTSWRTFLALHAGLHTVSRSSSTAAAELSPHVLGPPTNLHLVPPPFHPTARVCAVIRHRILTTSFPSASQPRLCCCFPLATPPRSLLDQSITRHFLSTVTDQQGKICAEYVWIGGSMHDVRSKSRTLSTIPTKPEVRTALVCLHA